MGWKLAVAMPTCRSSDVPTRSSVNPGRLTRLTTKSQSVALAIDNFSMRHLFPEGGPASLVRMATSKTGLKCEQGEGVLEFGGLRGDVQGVVVEKLSGDGGNLLGARMKLLAVDDD